jgi:hypothetical protein
MAGVAMATGDFDEGMPARRRRWPWALLLVALVFALGALAAGYAIVHVPRLASAIGMVPAETATAEIAATRIAALRSVPRPPPAPPAAAAPDPATADAIAELRGKVDDIETQARAATGDASRAEGLLVAFAARRALDRGFELGYIESLLRQRFGHTQPAAVATILSAARLPVTLADLQNGLDAVAPQLAGDQEHDGWWQALRRELSGMVTIRRADQPSTVPADRVARAQRMLEGGQVDGALAEVLRLPARDAAARWVVSARRYLAGRGALDRIETAALLDPGPATAPPAATPAAIPASAGGVAAGPQAPPSASE